VIFKIGSHWPATLNSKRRLISDRTGLGMKKPRC
jgi:hypothetical protein